jgi:hypothetical protein
MKITDDLLVGVVFTAFGAGAAILGTGYGIGTASEMGAGYVPTAVGGIVAILGLILAARALLKPAGRATVEFPELRPLVFVIAGVVAFGLLINVAGVVVAMLAMTAIAGMADRRGSWTGLAATGVLMTAAIVLIFIYGLGMNVPLWW